MFELTDLEITHATDIEQLLAVKEPISIANPPYWTSEMYGFGKCLREYGYYPFKWPLMVQTDHSGPHVIGKLNYFETSTTAPAVLFHSPEIVKRWQEQQTTRCYNLYAPFVFYRKKRRIQRSEEAKGTLAYPAHTLPEIDDVSNLESYIQQLQNLPQEYHPISVSLHYHDINKGAHKIFLQHKMRVFTAGNPADNSFVDKFYSILRNFRYVTSNIPGSYLFYAVEMGIPFFLYGNAPEFRKTSDSRLADEALDCINTRDEIMEKYEKTFANLTHSINKDQQELVDYTLGLHHGISRGSLALLLYQTYFNSILRKLSVKVNRKYRSIIGALIKKSNN